MSEWFRCGCSDPNQHSFILFLLYLVQYVYLATVFDSIVICKQSLIFIISIEKFVNLLVGWLIFVRRKRPVRNLIGKAKKKLSYSVYIQIDILYVYVYTYYIVPCVCMNDESIPWTLWSVYYIYGGSIGHLTATFIRLINVPVCSEFRYDTNYYYDCWCCQLLREKKNGDLNNSTILIRNTYDKSIK